MQNLKQEYNGPKKRKPVEVVVFEEPGRNKPMKKDRKRKNDRSGRLDNEKEDFAAIYSDVKEFGITGLSKKERKKIEDEKMQSLGARKPKGLKTPYPILQKAIKIRREREKQKEELEKEMGIFTKKKKDDKEKKVVGHGGWWKDEPIKLESSKNNIKIKASDLRSFSKRAKIK